MKNNECDPLSPPEGEAAQGAHPLDPHPNFLRHLRDWLSNLIRGFGVGDAPAE